MPPLARETRAVANPSENRLKAQNTSRIAKLGKRFVGPVEYLDNQTFTFYDISKKKKKPYDGDN